MKLPILRSFTSVQWRQSVFWSSMHHLRASTGIRFERNDVIRQRLRITPAIIRCAYLKYALTSLHIDKWTEYSATNHLGHHHKARLFDNSVGNDIATYLWLWCHNDFWRIFVTVSRMVACVVYHHKLLWTYCFNACSLVKKKHNMSVSPFFNGMEASSFIIASETGVTT